MARHRAQKAIDIALMVELVIVVFLVSAMSAGRGLEAAAEVAIMEVIWLSYYDFYI